MGPNVGSVRKLSGRLSSGPVSLAFGTAGPAIRPYVRNFWEVRGDLGGALDRALPTDEAALVLNLGSAQQVRGLGGLWQERCGSFIIGAQTAPLETRSGAGTWIIGARLTAQGLACMAAASPSELAGASHELGDLALPGYHSLLDRLHPLDPVELRFDRFASTLLDWVGAAPSAAREVLHALARIRASGGRLPVAALADDLGWSRQRLHRAFVDLVGLTPKTIARLIRFKRVIDLIGYDERVELADVAQRSGFFDQAHFSHDFRAFSGMSPGQYLVSRWPEGLRKGATAEA